MSLNGLGTLKGLLQLVHSLIMCDRRRSLRGIARQIGMFLGSSVCLDRYFVDVQGLS